MNPEFILGGVAPGRLAINYFQLGRKISAIFVTALKVTHLWREF